MQTASTPATSTKGHTMTEQPPAWIVALDRPFYPEVTLFTGPDAEQHAMAAFAEIRDRYGADEPDGTEECSVTIAQVVDVHRWRDDH